MQRRFEELEMTSADDSGAPMALIELARRGGRLRRLRTVEPDQVLVEFPMGLNAQVTTGYSRFCLLRSGDHALVDPLGDWDAEAS